MSYPVSQGIRPAARQLCVRPQSNDEGGKAGLQNPLRVSLHAGPKDPGYDLAKPFQG
jgi:hypothetical protein